MNRALRRTLDEIQRTKKKIEDWERHLEELEARKRQLEDAEILKSVHSMKLESHELLTLLEEIQSGAVSFRDIVGGRNDMDAASMGSEEHDKQGPRQEAAGKQKGDSNEDENENMAPAGHNGGRDILLHGDDGIRADGRAGGAKHGGGYGDGRHGG